MIRARKVWLREIAPVCPICGGTPDAWGNIPHIREMAVPLVVNQGRWMELVYWEFWRYDRMWRACLEQQGYREVYYICDRDTFLVARRHAMAVRLGLALRDWLACWWSRLYGWLTTPDGRNNRWPWPRWRWARFGWDIWSP